MIETIILIISAITTYVGFALYIIKIAPKPPTTIICKPRPTNNKI